MMMIVMMDEIMVTMTMEITAHTDINHKHHLMTRRRKQMESDRAPTLSTGTTAADDETTITDVDGNKHRHRRHRHRTTDTTITTIHNHHIAVQLCSDEM